MELMKEKTSVTIERISPTIATAPLFFFIAIMERAIPPPPIIYPSIARIQANTVPIAPRTIASMPKALEGVVVLETAGLVTTVALPVAAPQ